MLEERKAYNFQVFVPVKDGDNVTQVLLTKQCSELSFNDIKRLATEQRDKEKDIEEKLLYEKCIDVLDEHLFIFATGELHKDKYGFILSETPYGNIYLDKLELE